MTEVDRVLGNNEKMQAAGWADTAAAFARANDFRMASEEKILVNDIMAVREIAPHLIDGIESKVRAVVQVQNGCDHRCTFCVIPYGRGNSRSVPMGEVVAQVRRLAENGYREVVLSGVDLTSYGANLPGAPKLGTVVKHILRHVRDLARLRLSSIDCVEADRDLLDALASEARLMPHLHLSLQSGDDLILKRMKRRHSHADVISFCEQARRLRPDIVFGADIIAGFPTETEAMFGRSLDLVEECELTYLHVFPFSTRRGTPAARMPQVAREIVKERAHRLRQAGTAALVRHLDREIGNRRSVLVESKGRGRTEQFTQVATEPAAEPGSIVDVTISGHDGRRLFSDLL
jgi:threonylcarbamoyladenosine tRNA methylthiotransferase MtaB